MVGLTIGGTYLLFTQGSTVVLKALQKKAIFYTYPNMFVLSNLIYKMKDNARFLFVISIITAVVSSAVGVRVYFENMSAKTVELTPHAISYEEKGLNTHNLINEEKVQELVKRHGFEDARKVTYVKLPATITLFNSEHEVPMTIISEKEYNAEVRKQREQPTEVHNAPGATMVMVDMSNELMNRSYEIV